MKKIIAVAVSAAALLGAAAAFVIRREKNGQTHYRFSVRVPGRGAGN